MLNRAIVDARENRMKAECWGLKISCDLNKVIPYKLAWFPSLTSRSSDFLTLLILRGSTLPNSSFLQRFLEPEKHTQDIRPSPDLRPSPDSYKLSYNLSFIEFL